MHKVKRAIIMAAGTGSRMQPLTFNIPKPLVSVNGKRMIDTVIDSLMANGIEEIHIVVGYLKEKFAILKEKYPQVHFIENPYYDTCNNISSLYVAREYLEDVIILDGDQIIYNEAILAPYFEKSGYNSVWVENGTEEWLQEVDENQNVITCSRSGGQRGWQLYSISRWHAMDGKKLQKYLVKEFIDKKNRQIYWDDVAMFCHFEEFDLGIYPMKEGDIVEIDSLIELVAHDNSYQQYLQED